MNKWPLVLVVASTVTLVSCFSSSGYIPPPSSGWRGWSGSGSDTFFLRIYPIGGRQSFNTTTNYLYDPMTEKCCHGGVYPRENIPARLQQCCGAKSIDATLQRCCGGVATELKVGHACCGQTSHDVHDSLCCMGKVVPVPKEQFASAVCCGEGYVDTKSQLCCADKAVKRRTPQDTMCCYDLPLNAEKEVCCTDFSGGRNEQPTLRGQVLPLEGNKTFCCGAETFDPAQKQCCGSKLVSSTSACCGDNGFDPSTHVCCPAADQLKVVPLAGTNGNVCCGDKLFDPEKQSCCGDTITDIGVSCCGRQPLNQTKHMCVLRPEFKTELIPISNPGDDFVCGAKSYNTTTQRCCPNGKELSVVTKANQRAHVCCGNRTFEWNKGTCCRKGTEFRYHEGTTHATDCCGLETINLDTQVCCGGKVAAMNENTGCCGGVASFNLEKQLCCLDQRVMPHKYGVNERKSNATMCCGVKSYELEREICCGGSTVYKNDGNTACCGANSFNPETHVCCGQSVVANAKGKTACCFQGLGDFKPQPRPSYPTYPVMY